MLGKDIRIVDSTTSLQGGFKSADTTNGIPVMNSVFSAQEGDPSGLSPIDSKIMRESGSFSANMPAITDRGLKILQKIDAIKKQKGPIIPVATALEDKIKNISHTYINIIGEFTNELFSMCGKEDISEEDVDAKIREKQSKIEAIEREVQVKLNVMDAIANKLSQFNAILQKMEDQGIPTEQITGSLIEMINNMNASPSNFEEGEDSDKVSEEIKESVLGANIGSNFDSQKRVIELRKQELNQILQDPSKSKEEKDKAQVELEALNLEIELLDEIKGLFN